MTAIPKYLLNRKESRIPFTQDGYDKMLAEKKQLDAQRPDAVENLRKAREMGDLSENGYYKASRQRLSFIDARLRRLTNILKRATIVAKVKTGFVDIGSRVTLRGGDRQVIYTIVGGFESDPSKQTVSHQSPIGRAVMGKRAGDTVVVRAPSGELIFEVVAID